MSSKPNFPSKLRIFCDGSSIRGMQKITKAPTTFLRVMWVGFVLTMTMFLFIMSLFVVFDFLLYDSAWHTTIFIDDKTEFPAISLCSHNPFSTRANDVWSKGDVLSPTNFQKHLLNISRVYAKNGDGVMGTFSLMGSTENYYANLEHSTTIELGHGREMVYFCLTTTQSYSTVAENCSLEALTKLYLVRFSHRKYFNCWTIQGKPNESTWDITNLIILLKLTPLEDLAEMKENFVMDVMTQGEGVKLVIHEPYTFPDIDKTGINVQPGKMNEISYRPIRWNRYSSPTRPCLDDQPPIKDLDNTYNYTFEQCLDSRIQEEIIKHCKCMLPNYPRKNIPGPDIQYCFNLTTDARLANLYKTTKCYDIISQKIKDIKTEAQKEACLPRCKYMTYETQLSVTKWKPSPYKIHRLTQLYRAVDAYLIDVDDQKRRDDYIDILDKPQNNFQQQAEIQKDQTLKEDRFSYISLNRQNGDTTVKREKLILDINVLLSRIGGLCSLSIGLTTAFIIELVEFIYLSLRVEKQRRNTMIAAALAASPSNSVDASPTSNKDKTASFKTTINNNVTQSLISQPGLPLDEDETNRIKNSFNSDNKPPAGYCRLPSNTSTPKNVPIPLKLTHPVRQYEDDDGEVGHLLSDPIYRRHHHHDNNESIHESSSVGSPWQRANSKDSDSEIAGSKFEPVSTV